MLSSMQTKRFNTFFFLNMGAIPRLPIQICIEHCTYNNINTSYYIKGNPEKEISLVSEEFFLDGYQKALIPTFHTSFCLHNNLCECIKNTNSKGDLVLKNRF